MRIINWLANNNFFNRHTIIRKWQCSIFGHDWYCWITLKDGKKWCAWCGRYTSKYPKMRKNVNIGKDQEI